MAVHRLRILAEIHFNVGPRSGGRWHVGSGFRTAGVDRLVRRFPGRTGVPFIPGTQIRGVLRTQCERILYGIGGPYSDPHDASINPAAKRRPWALEVFRPLRDLPAECVVDRLFGTRFQGERLFVSNAFPEEVVARWGYAQARPTESGDTPTADQDTRSWSVSAVTRTSMDRLLGIVAEGKLFTTEVVSSTRPYIFTLNARHQQDELTVVEDTPAEYAILVAGLLAIDALGGDKSTGLGWCSIKIREAVYQGRPIDENALLKPLADMGSDYLGFIEEYRNEASGGA